MTKFISPINGAQFETNMTNNQLINSISAKFKQEFLVKSITDKFTKPVAKPESNIKVDIKAIAAKFSK